MMSSSTAHQLSTFKNWLVFFVLVFNVDQHEAAEGVLLDDDLNEPTMGEKLASLSVLDGNKSRSDIEQESSIPAKPPSADSVHVLLKQALNADDRTLLLDCLFTQNEKVLFLSYFYWTLCIFEWKLSTCSVSYMLYMM